MYLLDWIVQGVVFAGVVFVLFIGLRWVSLWYFRVNEIVKLLTDIRDGVRPSERDPARVDLRYDADTGERRAS